MSARIARTYIHVIASRWITTRQHISFPRRCQTFRLLPRPPDRPSTHKTALGASRCPPHRRCSPSPWLRCVRTGTQRQRRQAYILGVWYLSSSPLPAGFPLISASLLAPAATTLLAQKLRAEISYEAEVQQDDMQVGAVPQDVTGLLQEGGWRWVLRPAIFTVPGLSLWDDRSRTRRRTTRCSSRASSETESIRVMLSVADLQSIPDEDEPEPEAIGRRGAHAGTSRCVSGAITKPTHPGALHADLYCADGPFDIANIAYHKDARVATKLSIAIDWERRTLWTGPLAYLRARGVDGALAGFVPRYALWKEQRVNAVCVLSLVFFRWFWREEVVLERRGAGKTARSMVLCESLVLLRCLYDFQIPGCRFLRGEKARGLVGCGIPRVAARRGGVRKGLKPKPREEVEMAVRPREGWRVEATREASGSRLREGRAGGCTGELMGWRVEPEGKRRKGKDEEGDKKNRRRRPIMTINIVIVFLATLRSYSITATMSFRSCRDPTW
ncbi:hypothetical protein B0H14DRAFT_3148353 [Mycena olivaceomarginata]|nr:hypothetical protein B0H14DRAFT_3148353 [Mycena olivaceomarginata]